MNAGQFLRSYWVPIVMGLVCFAVFATIMGSETVADRNRRIFNECMVDPDCNPWLVECLKHRDEGCVRDAGRLHLGYRR